MNSKEQQRIMVLNEMERRSVTAVEAAVLIGVSVRQVRRLVAAYRRDGPGAIAHGNRGRASPRAIDGALRERVLQLARGPYDGANHTHLTELLAEREGLSLSRSTVRRILLDAGIRTPRRRRPPRHRRRRERYPQEGMLLQVDGSRHDWLQGRGPWLTLIGGIDDATGTVPFACFREQEDTQGYFLLVEGVARRKGLPVALYADRNSIFTVTAPHRETIEEQLTGVGPRTQFGRALEELGIRLILAHSPQAKGRVERLWGTFQDRLLTALRLAGASTIEEANTVLEDFLPAFNQRFAVPAAQAGSAYRPCPTGAQLAEALCFKHQRSVAADNTVRWEGQVFQLQPTPQRTSYAQARVEVQERLDGNIVIAYQGRAVPWQQAPPAPPALRATAPQERPGQPSAVAPGVKPADNHPWRRPLKAPG